MCGVVQEMVISGRVMGACGLGRVPVYSTAAVRLPCQASWCGPGLLFLHPQYSSVGIFVWKAPASYYHCILGVNLSFILAKIGPEILLEKEIGLLKSGYLRHIL